MQLLWLKEQPIGLIGEFILDPGQGTFKERVGNISMNYDFIIEFNPFLQGKWFEGCRNKALAIGKVI
jgi:hypothetical protein